MAADETHHGASQLVRSAKHTVTSGAYSRSPESLCRLPFPDRTGSVERVGDLPQRVHESVLSVGDTVSRPDGDGDEQSRQGVHLSSDSPLRPGSRCVQDAVAAAVPAVHISTSQHSPEGTQPYPPEGSTQTHPDSVNGNLEGLPSGSRGDGSPTAGTSLQTGGLPAADPTHGAYPACAQRAGVISFGSVASGGPKPSINRLESIANVLRSQGHSERVIKFVQRPQRESTAGVYAHHWESFVSYCRKDKINPLNASDAVIADYLVYLFEVKNLLVNTIKVHRAAISSVVKHLRPEVLNSTTLKDLVHRLELERPRVKRVYP